MPKKSIPIAIATVLMLMFSSCTCIYFNTFHNIRKNFNAAEDSRSKDNREEARGSEIKHYQDAIAKASRVLERHPTSSWVDDALYIIGASYYHLGEYDKATRKFKELFANYPESEYIERSRVLMAKTKLELGEEAEAVVLFEDVFEKDRDNSRKASAARSLGEYYFETKDYETANTYFMSLIDSLGDRASRVNALIYVADGYFDMFSFARAVENYELALKQNPDTLQYYHIMFRLAECDFFRNRISEGLDKLADLADNELYYDSLAAIRMKMAEGYEWEGDFNSAIDTYEQIIVENPRKTPAAVAYYRLGLIHQYDYEDLRQARLYYQKSREESIRSSVSEDAKRRAAKLALLEEYSREEETEMPEDSIESLDQRQLDARSEDQYLLGELFYFDLEKPDSAITAFQTLLDRYPKSRYAPRALMTMAHIYREDYRDTAAADSVLRVVLQDYSQYDEAEDVIDMLGLAGTVADTGYAAIPFSRASEFLDTFRELDSSMYYVRLSIDSILAADSAAAADSLAADSAMAPDSIQIPDSMTVEDMYLTGDTGLAADSEIVSSPPAADTSASTQQPRVSGAELMAEQRRKADSIRKADSAAVADSLRAEELARRADSLRAVHQQRMQDDRDTTTPADELPPDTTVFADSLSLAEMVAMAHEEAKTEEAAPDSMETETPDIGSGGVSASDESGGIMGPPLPPETSQIVGPPLPPEQSQEVGPQLPEQPRATDQPPSSASASEGGRGNLLDSLRQQALNAGAKPRSQADVSSQDADSRPRPPSPDPEQLAETTPDDVGATDQADTANAADETPEIVRKDLIEYWREAYQVAEENYSDTQRTLLDSAAHYYAYIIDSFPHSRYSVQSRYALLWTYDRYLTPGDSILPILYQGFVDSFPETEFAEAIAENYNILSANMPTRRQQQQQQDEEDLAAEDTALYADADTLNSAADSLPQDGPLVDSKYIRGENGEILEPAEKYFLREEVPFKYPLDALAYNVEGDLYFQIKINPYGEVVDYKFMNPTRSDVLNEMVTETVANTYFDQGRIDPKLYDTWFWYVYEVRIPQHLRQR